VESLLALPKKFFVSGGYRREQGIDGGKNFFIRAHLRWPCPPDEPTHEKPHQTDNARRDNHPSSLNCAPPV
jgi:hypothetical protein